uniref:Uncharacterized protein n=1 Tax=Ixodes ricinus TaxID=34613 RepID=A0A6B0UQB3_IXORI
MHLKPPGELQFCRMPIAHSVQRTTCHTELVSTCKYESGALKGCLFCKIHISVQHFFEERTTVPYNGRINSPKSLRPFLTGEPCRGAVHLERRSGDVLTRELKSTGREGQPKAYTATRGKKAKKKKGG